MIVNEQGNISEPACKELGSVGEEGHTWYLSVAVGIYLVDLPLAGEVVRYCDMCFCYEKM